MQKSRFFVPYLLSLIVVIPLFFKIFLISTLKEYTPTPIIEDSNGVFLTEGDGNSQQLGFWDVDDYYNLRVTKAIIAIEDKRFMKHSGVDIKSIFRAVKANIVSGTPEGASTIAMQVARIQEQSKRNIFTKFIETLAAVVMTFRYGRDEVLNQYLEIVPMGRRAHGVSYASRRYFKKPVYDLSWAEAALLSSLPKAPGRMDLTNYRGMYKAKERAAIVLKRLLDQKIITTEIYNRAMENLETFRALGVEKRPGNSYHYILRLYDQLEEREFSSFKTTTKTNLDGELQKYLADYIDSIYPDLLKRDVDNISLVISDKEGKILAYIGSQNYYNDKHHGSINYANRKRSSGSTLKPFLYLKGLDSGTYFPNSIVDDLPIHIIDENGSYIAANYDEDFLGPMLYRKTLANSRNIPSVRVLEKVGQPLVYEYFRKLNFVHRELSPEYYGYGMILGGLYVTLEDLVTAYGSLLNDGREFKLKWFSDDTNSNGITAGSAYNSRLITHYLSDASSRLPSFPRLGPLEYSYPVAIKTGTSQGFRDAWSIAYSQDYIAGIWLGRHDNGKMNHVSGSTAAKYLHDIMDYLHPEQVKGFNQKPFRKPEPSIEIPICPLSGGIKGPNCDNSITEFFKESEIPVDLCDVHIKLAVDKFTGALANHQTPVKNIEARIYISLPSRYAVWSKKNGIELPANSYDTDINSLQPELKITQPRDGARFIFDFEIPARFQSIPLIADIEPRLPEVEWIINNKLYKKEPYPYKLRFSLEPGIYKIELKSGDYRSKPVTIYVD